MSLTFDEALSNVAFHFNLRRCTKGKYVLGGACGFKFPGRVSEYSDDRWSVPDGQSEATVGRCKLKPVETRVDSACFQ